VFSEFLVSRMIVGMMEELLLMFSYCYAMSIPPLAAGVVVVAPPEEAGGNYGEYNSPLMRTLYDYDMVCCCSN